MASTQPARGMRDFLPADVRKREYVIGIIKQVYESYGFEPLETPAVENIDTLMGKYGDEGNQLIFKILKRGEKLKESGDSELADLALRYDLTVPLARVVANNRNVLPKFFKRYQIQPVWRADRPARGRFREFYQCDADWIGSESVVVEAELIGAVCEILRRLGFDDFSVRLNHRGILQGILDKAGIDLEKQSIALTILDKLDKIGIEGVVKEFNDGGITQVDMLTGLIPILNQGDPRPALIGLALLVEGHSAGTKAIDFLDDLLLATASAPIRIDPTLARGLSYYTGTIMEINVSDLAGSLGGGGRYDGLIGMFGKEQIPACGFSLGLERILVVMDERGMFPPEIAESAPADVMVTIWSEETAAESLKLAQELRSSGLRVTLYPEPDKLGKQIKYADSIKVPFVCVLGETEIADGSVTVKNMKTGDQRTMPREEAASNIA